MGAAAGFGSLVTSSSAAVIGITAVANCIRKSAVEAFVSAELTGFCKTGCNLSLATKVAFSCNLSTVS